METDDGLRNDLLRGVDEIARFLGETPRRTVYGLERGHIPAGKLGGRWIASRSALREHFRRVTGGTAAQG